MHEPVTRTCIDHDNVHLEMSFQHLLPTLHVAGNPFHHFEGPQQSSVTIFINPREFHSQVVPK